MSNPIQSQKLESVGSLADGIAHDLNNILTGVFGFAELARKADDLSVAHQYCDEIILLANRARDVVDRILSFSCRPQLNQKPVDLLGGQDLLGGRLTIASDVVVVHPQAQETMVDGQ